MNENIENYHGDGPRHNETVWTDRTRDVVIARVVDGEASQAEWDRFCLAAQGDSSLWRELAESQREQSALVAAVNRVLAVADEVEAPTRELGSIQFNRRLRMVAGMGGWAIAAVLALAIIGPRLGVAPAGNASAMQAGFGPSDVVLRDPAPKDVLQAYYNRGMEHGTVLGEMPQRVLVGSRPAATGKGVEVFYIRQIMEREIVPGLYRLGSDEAGRPMPVPAEIIHAGGRAY